MPYYGRMEPSAIARACDLAGGQSCLARQLNVKPPTVNEWVSKGRAVPDARCADVERICEGRVTCEQLREDIVWHRVADKAWPWHPKGRPLKDVVRTAQRRAELEPKAA